MDAPLVVAKADSKELGPCVSDVKGVVRGWTVANKSIATLALGSALSGVTICSHAARVWVMGVNHVNGRARRSVAVDPLVKATRVICKYGRECCQVLHNLDVNDWVECFILHL